MGYEESIGMDDEKKNKGKPVRQFVVNDV